MPISVAALHFLLKASPFTAGRRSVTEDIIYPYVLLPLGTQGIAQKIGVTISTSPYSDNLYMYAKAEFMITSSTEQAIKRLSLILNCVPYLT